MTDLDPDTRQKLEAAAFRALIHHLLKARPDVQNIDLMNLAGFCRNCLSRWYQEAAEADGITMTKDQAREIVYGMPYADWVAQNQTAADAGKQPSSRRRLPQMWAPNHRPSTARQQSHGQGCLVSFAATMPFKSRRKFDFDVNIHQLLTFGANGRRLAMEILMLMLALPLMLLGGFGLDAATSDDEPADDGDADTTDQPSII